LASTADSYLAGTEIPFTELEGFHT
jgi:hypothetical protein